MSKRILLFMLILYYIPSFCSAQVWLNDLESGKRASKLHKKPMLLWVGINGFRTRPMEVGEEKFKEAAKKIICVNLDPRHMTEEQRGEFGVNDSNFSMFYYYDLDMNLLGSEASPPRGLMGGVDRMLKSMEKKEEEVKAEKEEAKVDNEADELWKRISALETNEKYGEMVPLLKQMGIKYPTSPYAELAKLKLEKIENDPILKKAVEAQKYDEAAGRLYRSAATYIKNKKPDLAKKKLNEILTEYPDSSVVKDAKELLKTLE